jgi:enoyl-CoA hydratase
MILASADAQFGFPEIKLGTMPGLGGTQRLTKAMGKYKVGNLLHARIPNFQVLVRSLPLSILTSQAMELVLTGDPRPATEMERFGLVNKVCSAEEDVLEEATKLAERVAAYSAPAIGLAKQAIKAGKHPWPVPNNPTVFGLIARS